MQGLALYLVGALRKHHEAVAIIDKHIFSGLRALVMQQVVVEEAI